MSATENIRAASRDMAGHLRAIRSPGCTPQRAAAARHDAVVTGDLMNATSLSAWQDGPFRRLDRLVGAVMCATSALPVVQGGDRG